MHKTLAYLLSLVFLAGTAQASFLPPGGTTGSVQYRTSATQFGGEAAFTYDATNNRLALSSATTATDNATQMFSLSGTLPASPSAGVQGVRKIITSAGSASQQQVGEFLNLAAGYTGSSSTVGYATTNSAAGTGGAFSQTTIPTGNIGTQGIASATTTGWTVGGAFSAGGGSGTDVGVYGVAGTAVTTSQHIGVLGIAANSGQATNLKNVAVYGTLNSSLLAGANSSYAGLFDGGTLPDSGSRALAAIGTLPSTATATQTGFVASITSAGSSGQDQYASYNLLNAGYTGSSATAGSRNQSSAAGTGTTLNLTATTSPAAINHGSMGLTSAATAGYNAGASGSAAGSTVYNFGLFGKASFGNAGANIGVFGSGASSTEATDLKNVGGYFSLGTAPITGSNVSAAVIADNGAESGAYIVRWQDNGTLKGAIEDEGNFHMVPPSAQTINDGNEITANACGGFKAITSAGVVTTNTSNTFTAPAAGNTGCVMQVCNVGANNIILDNNANFKSNGGIDQVLGATDCVAVANNGTAWYQIAPMSVN
jgi:hypothetical protein